VTVARRSRGGKGDMAGDAAVDVGHQRDRKGVVQAQGVDGAGFQPALAGRIGEGPAQHVADGVDVVRTLLADPHGGSLPLACWRPSWDRGGERRVMPADESKTAAPRRGAAAAMRDAALVSVAEVTHAGEHHRSEERRVGKECWCRGTSNSYKRATLSSRRNTDDGCV